jgi:hypothetical protein
MRTATTDEQARRWFRRYWTFGVGFGAHVLVNGVIDLAKGRALSGYEAYGRLVCTSQARLEHIERDIEAAREQGDLRAVAALHRVAVLVDANVYELGMKLGVLKQAPTRVKTGRNELSPVARVVSKLSH